MPRRTSNISRALAKLAGPLALAACLLALAMPVAAQAQSVKDRAIQVSDEERDELLGSARIGAQTGGLTAQYVENDYQNAEVSEFTTLSDIVAALDAGKVDYAIEPLSATLLYMRTNAKYTYLGNGLYSFDSRLAVGKGKDELTEKLSAAITKLKEDGTVDAVIAKWTVEGNYSTDDIPEIDDPSAPVLTVASACAMEPVMFIQDGKPTGSLIELVKRAAYECGMRTEFIDTNFASCLAAVSTGKADVALNVSKTPEREKEMNFTESFYDEPWVAMTIDEDAEPEGFFDTLEANFTSTFLAESRWQMILGGLGVTVAVALGAFVLATVFGAALCWLDARGGAAAAFSRAYCRLVTGIPVLVWLMLLYYVVFAGVDIPAVAVAILCFGLEAAAPLSDVFSAGLASVDKGQVEAALALGFSHGETFRRVVLPQAARSVWGLYSGQLTSLIKGTSVVGYVAITDLTKVSDIIRSRTFQAFFPLVSTALIYFAAIALFAWLLGLLGRTTDPRRRPAPLILKGIEVK